MSTPNQRSVGKERFWRRMVQQSHDSVGASFLPKAWTGRTEALLRLATHALRARRRSEQDCPPRLRAGTVDPGSADDRHDPERRGRSRRHRVGPQLRSAASRWRRLRCADAAAPGGAPRGGPAVLLGLPTSVSIWLASQATDLRLSFDSLAEVVRQHPARRPACRVNSSCFATSGPTGSSSFTGMRTVL